MNETFLNNRRHRRCSCSSKRREEFIPPKDKRLDRIEMWYVKITRGKASEHHRDYQLDPFGNAEKESEMNLLRNTV